MLSVIASRDTLGIPNMTRGLLFPRGAAWWVGLKRDYGVSVIRLCVSGTGPEGVLLALQCIDVRVYLGGETARAVTQKLPPREHTHMAALFTNTRPEREVRCYVTASKRIASLPASRRAAAPTRGQPAWKLWRQFRYEKLRVRKEEIKSSSHNSVCAREVGETESMGTLLLQRIAQRQAFIVKVRRLNWLFNFSVELDDFINSIYTSSVGSWKQGN